LSEVNKASLSKTGSKRYKWYVSKTQIVIITCCKLKI